MAENQRTSPSTNRPNDHALDAERYLTGGVYAGEPSAVSDGQPTIFYLGGIPMPTGDDQQDRPMTGDEVEEQNFEYEEPTHAPLPEAGTPAVNAVVAQVGGSHYSKTSGVCPNCGGEIQHWDLHARHPYLESQISRYILRWQEKGGLEDLDKARSFFDKLQALARAGKA